MFGDNLNPTPAPEPPDTPDEDQGQSPCATCGDIWPNNELDENGDCPECAHGDDEEDEEYDAEEE